MNLKDGSPFGIPDDLAPLRPLYGPDVARRWMFYAGAGNAYVYALCYPSGLPFYVGSGIDERALAHASECRTNRRIKDRSEKHEIIDWLQLHNEQVWYHFLGLTDDREEAFAIEAHWIQKFGRRETGGILTNLSDEEERTASFQSWRLSPPELPDDETVANRIRTFRHPDIVVPPPYPNASRTRRITACPKCLEQGQMLAKMLSKNVACWSCGHFFEAF